MNAATLQKPETKKAREARIIEAGRAELRVWLEAAEAHGTIYYNVEHVARSGMSRRITLSTIAMGRDGKPELRRLWPSLGDEWSKFNHVEYNAALDVIARDWRFNFDRRAFVVGGCGMDMVFALVYDLAMHAFDQPRAMKFANSVRREAF